MANYAIGSLVKARGREWVVLPESEEDMLVLRPLGGTDAEVTGIYLPLETVEPASFDLPNPSQVGDYRSARLLRDAVRLGFRNSAGPFRSFARLAVEPRPYQLVPLLMALKLDPVRLLIADDVGVGKTVEAGLIARELLDRGEIERLAVLCPPQLAEQWQAELREKFHIDAVTVLPSTVSRLERERVRRFDQSIFEVYPFTIVSTDYIKADRRRDDFQRTCPELVIVDEAHTCAFGGEGRSGKHQRHQLISGLAADPARNMILVTATPHSGKEEAFRSLLQFLHDDFAELPEDFSGATNTAHRRKLAQYFVQRRRADIRHFMQAETPFPEREEAELTYKLSPEYRKLFERVLEYARETVQAAEGGENRFRQRVRWWSALALLRSMASSPAAAAATLKSRAATLDAESPESADEIGKRTVLDLMEDESLEGMDVIPGGDIGDQATDEEKNQRRLTDMARAAEKLYGDADFKLQGIIEQVKTLIKEGHRPIVFCRFIPTAEYVAEAFRGAFRGVEVMAVTGTLPPSERESRVHQLGEAEKRVLVCTDCLSEGINLQDHFDAVIHYDLSWNPTRHEQREGRVDRYGQPNPKVRVLTYYGVDNQIDGIVLDVLLRKHQTIRSSLGISVPVPVDTDQVIEAIFEGLLLRSGNAPTVFQGFLPGFEDFIKPKKDELFRQWEQASDREKRSRTMFAQETLKGEDVAQELKAAREAVGLGVDAEQFFAIALRAHRAVVSHKAGQGNGRMEVDLRETPQGLRDVLGQQDGFKARFQLPLQDGELLLTRTHTLVEGLATYVMDTALDALGEGAARRCGAIRTKAVTRRTTLLLARFRYHLLTRKGEEEFPLLAEEVLTLAFEGSPENAEWLTVEQAEALLEASPDGNVNPQQAGQFVQRVVDGFEYLSAHLGTTAHERANELLEAHQRVREAARMKGVRYRVEAQMPPDVLGIYVYLPVI